jgi:hypothetical protein
MQFQWSVFTLVIVVLLAFSLVRTNGEYVLSTSHDVQPIKIDTVNRYYRSGIRRAGATTAATARAAVAVVTKNDKESTAQALKSLTSVTSSLTMSAIIQTYALALSTSLYGLEVVEFLWSIIGRCFRLEVGLGRFGWYNHVYEGESSASIDPNSPWFGLVQIVEPRFGSTYSNDSAVDSTVDASPLRAVVRTLSSLTITLPLGKALMGYFLLTDTQYGGQMVLKLYSAALAFVRLSYFMAHDLGRTSEVPTWEQPRNTTAPSQPVVFQTVAGEPVHVKQQALMTHKHVYLESTTCTSN